MNPVALPPSPKAPSRKASNIEPGPEVAPALLRSFSIIHALLALLFVCMALLLLYIAAKGIWELLSADLNDHAARRVIEAMGVLAAAVVALQIAQTITEEEVIRSAHISAPTRVRRFLSRFMVVIVVALAIEGLVATFRASHEGATMLLHAAAMVTAVGILLAGWGLFIRLNRYAEELEPEAMQDAKQEDQKLE
jgi:Ni/Fe-hydrogenase subunit HybB-like protein